MNKILFILLSVTIAIVTSVAGTHERGPIQVVLSQEAESESVNQEPVPADCFVDPQTGEVEVVRTDGEGDLYVTVSEEDVPVASTRLLLSVIREPELKPWDLSLPGNI